MNEFGRVTRDRKSPRGKSRDRPKCIMSLTTFDRNAYNSKIACTLAKAMNDEFDENVTKCTRTLTSIYFRIKFTTCV